MTSIESRIFNVRPDRPDPRDHTLRAVRKPKVEIPESLIYTEERVGPVWDQGETGSCAGQFGKGLIYSLYHEIVSARWIWMVAKEIDSWVPSSMFDGAGTDLRSIMKVLRKYGACSEALWQFPQQLPDPDLEQDIIEDALTRRIGRFWRLESEDDVKENLVLFGPSLMAVPVYENWADIKENGIVPHPEGRELGGHALARTGYDSGWKLAKNSWGRGHGDHGYLKFPSTYPIWDQFGTGSLVR